MYLRGQLSLHRFITSMTTLGVRGRITTGTSIHHLRVRFLPRIVITTIDIRFRLHLRIGATTIIRRHIRPIFAISAR